ncbi:hypothetical protein HYV10_02715 [Candidatus Dependentiae bacterium]|nr:hypothetical protein [Candidatus Dependentiae bacterium]
MNRGICLGLFLFTFVVHSMDENILDDRNLSSDAKSGVLDKWSLEEEIIHGAQEEDEKLMDRLDETGVGLVAYMDFLSRDLENLSRFYQVSLDAMGSLMDQIKKESRSLSKLSEKLSKKFFMGKNFFERLKYLFTYLKSNDIQTYNKLYEKFPKVFEEIAMENNYIKSNNYLYKIE